MKIVSNVYTVPGQMLNYIIDVYVKNELTQKFNEQLQRWIKNKKVGLIEHSIDIDMDNFDEP